MPNCHPRELRVLQLFCLVSDRSQSVTLSSTTSRYHPLFQKHNRHPMSRHLLQAKRQMALLRAGLGGQLLPVLVGVLLGIAVVLLHGSLTGHPHRHLEHLLPPSPPVRPLHLVADAGRLHMVSEPQPKVRQVGQIGATLDFSPPCAPTLCTGCMVPKQLMQQHKAWPSVVPPHVPCCTRLLLPL